MERVPPSICPEAVTEPWYHQRWDSLTFLHWEVEPSAIQRLLPKPLVVDTLDGAAWVGLVPFEMQNVEVRVPALPGPPRTVGVPGSQRFPETNVRTYVIGPAGQRGVWLFPSTRPTRSRPPRRGCFMVCRISGHRCLSTGASGRSPTGHGVGCGEASSPSPAR